MYCFLLLSRALSTTRPYQFLKPANVRLNQRKNGRRKPGAASEVSWPAATGLRMVAQSTGVRIKATATDRSMEATIVKENCR